MHMCRPDCPFWASLEFLLIRGRRNFNLGGKEKYKAWLDFVIIKILKLTLIWIKKITTIYKLEKYMYSCLYNMFHI